MKGVIDEIINKLFLEEEDSLEYLTKERDRYIKLRDKSEDDNYYKFFDNLVKYYDEKLGYKKFCEEAGNEKGEK